MELEVRELTKEFGPVTAVRDVSFTAPAGQVTGLLGPNGSGKTTTLRVALGLVRPSGLQYFAPHADVVANRSFPANAIENTGYLGIPLIILVIVIVVWLIRRKDRFAYWWLLTAAAAVVLSFGTRLWVDGHLTKIPLPLIR